jgi:probable phosphoglycerate mutase
MKAGNRMKLMSGKKSRGVKIFMLRHGKPQFPDDRAYVYGHTDYQLSETGKGEARSIGKALSNVPMDRIVSSDLSRAAETANIVAELQKKKLCSVERDAMLREINMGEWDGLTKDNIVEGYVDIFRMRGRDIANVRPPGGESFQELRQRGLDALERIVQGSKGFRNILLVAHGAILWGIISGIFGMQLGDIYRFGLDYCGVHLVEHCGETERQWGEYRLIRYNWLPDIAEYMDDLV